MIMNKIQIYIPVLILALAASSCSKVLEKDEAEASFARKGELPEVSDVKLVSVDEYAGTAVVEATFSGISDDMHSLEIGFISADDYALTGTTNQRNRALIDNPADGTYRRTIAVSAGVPNYIVAMAASDDGAVYSRRLSVDVPDVPWQYKVGEEYSGTVTSYNDGSSTYEHTVRLKFSDDFSRLTVYDIDPYLRANLLGADDGYESGEANWATGTVDLENRTVTFASGTSGVAINAGSYYIYPIDRIENETYYKADSFVLTFNEDASELSFPMFGLLANGSLTDVYNGFTLAEN